MAKAKCPKCGATFPDQGALRVHIIEAHSNRDK